MKEGKYSALDVAYEAINLLNKEKSVVSNLKMQKLLYFFQGLYSVPDHEALFKDEFEAWQYGPVVRAVYREFRMFGANSIPAFSQAYLERKEIRSLEEEDKGFIHDIALILKDCSASDLVNMTHEQSPWQNAYDPKKTDNLISFESIDSYFNETYGKQE